VPGKKKMMKKKERMLEEEDGVAYSCSTTLVFHNVFK